MKCLIILTRGAYKCHMFYFAFRSHLRDGQQNFLKIVFVLVTENSIRQRKKDVIVDTGACRFRKGWKVPFADVTDDSAFFQRGFE